MNIDEMLKENAKKLCNVKDVAILIPTEGMVRWVKFDMEFGNQNLPPYLMGYWRIALDTMLNRGVNAITVMYVPCANGGEDCSSTGDADSIVVSGSFSYFVDIVKAYYDKRNKEFPTSNLFVIIPDADRTLSLSSEEEVESFVKWLMEL